MRPHESRSPEAVFRQRLHEFRSRQSESLQQELAALTARVAADPGDADACAALADCQQSLGDTEGSLCTLRAAIGRAPRAAKLHRSLIEALKYAGLDDEALEAGERACALVPEDSRLLLQFHLYLPEQYDSAEDIPGWHRRFAQGLECVIASCDLRSADGARRALRGIEGFVPFYLPYQGYDDLPLVRGYGAFVHATMSANYPVWSQPIRPQPSGRLKVGFVSSLFREHTVSRLFGGWIFERHRSAYTAHVYYVGKKADSATAEFCKAADTFFHERDLESAAGTIRSDELDILVFTDIGMDPLITQLAALRLAPVQCVAWGHPVTTGLPTIDVFLSGDAMEGPDAEAHYTERLVRLPGLGICYRSSVVPRPAMTKTREDFGLPRDAAVYLCCQSLFKYLPQHDRLLAAIARQVPNAAFVFIAGNTLARARFLQRLERAFHAEGLRAEAFCHFVSGQNSFDYLNLNLVSDVFLDTVGWSGGKTSLDATACALPIVTLPGTLMRSRHTVGILSMLDVPETVAHDEAEYINFAIRLGTDPAWRAQVSARIRANRSQAFSDPAAVRRLEQFFAEERRPLAV